MYLELDSMIHGIISELYPVSSGIPRGSHLSLLLFILFINSIGRWTTKTKTLLFVNDVKVYLRINSPVDCLLLKAELNIFCDWDKRHGFTSMSSLCSINLFRMLSYS